MSRTIKDRPYWLVAFDPVTGGAVEHDHRRGSCAVQSLADARDWALSRRPSSCSCLARPKREHRHRAWGNAHPPSWYTNATFHRPSRRRARLGCAQFVKQRNAGAEPEVEVDTRPARHGACRWWDWD